MALSNNLRERYSRQTVLDGIGEKGQEKLQSSSVLIIGIGGLGTPAALYLAAAGIGRLGLVDNDKVELSNLQRQILHYTSDIGQLKVLSAAQKLERFNPDIVIEQHPVMVSSDNIMALIQPYDFIIDAVDNFSSKFLINDACVKLKKPFCHAGVFQYQGQLFTYDPQQKSACYRCLFQAPPCQDKRELKKQDGILGVVAGVIGVLQAEEAIKYLLGLGKLLINRLLIHDVLAGRFREVNFLPRHDCTSCGTSRQITKARTTAE